MSVTIEKSVQMDVQIRLFINNISTKLNHLPKVCRRFGEKFRDDLLKAIYTTLQSAKF